MRRVFQACSVLLLQLLLLNSVPAKAQPPALKSFVSKDGRFSVQLSSRPIYSSHSVGTGDAATIDHVFILEKGDAAYYVSYSDFKPEVIKDASITKILDGARDGGVANSKGKLLSEKSITLDGNPGREIAIDLPGAKKTKVRARFYMVDNRLYTIIFAGPYPEADSAETNAFLASLKLQIPKALPDTWMALDSPEGRFHIRMPAKPAVSEDQPGKKDSTHLWQLLSDKDEVSYFVAYNDLPAVLEAGSDIEKALDGGRDALAKSLSAKVEDETLLSVDGNPGREAHMRVVSKDAPDVVILFRGFIVKDRYYQVMALGSKAAMEKGRVDGYMDSFQLISGGAVATAQWVPISDGVLKQLSDAGKKIGYPGGTAGVCVDRTSGDVYMIVPDQGIWKSTDRGVTFARADGGALGGRCETGFTLNPAPAGKRLAAFMLDGHAVLMSGSGKTWKPLHEHGRGWDYGTADWSSPDPQTLLAVHHESGEELNVSADGGDSWKLLGKDYTGLGVFDSRTFVATKGIGILRTTDSGATWSQVSDLTPTGRVLCVLNGTGYWVSGEGLLVSNDKGQTWHRQGSPIEAAWGPFFGRNARQIVVVGRVDKVAGFYRSDDAGMIWKLAAPFPTFEKESIPDWTPAKQWAAGWFCCFGWDPIGNIFYASRMGHPTLKYVTP